jgi:hypothetical protein
VPHSCSPVIGTLTIREGGPTHDGQKHTTINRKCTQDATGINNNNNNNNNNVKAAPTAQAVDLQTITTKYLNICRIAWVFGFGTWYQCGTTQQQQLGKNNIHKMGNDKKTNCINPQCFIFIRY